MTSQAVPELGQGARTARNILLGIPPRMFQQARQLPAGGALARASHPQFATLHAAPGDRVYLCAFANGTLALVGRLTLDGSPVADGHQGTIVGKAPFTACRADRIVPHEVVRDLRAVSGGALRFARASEYQLHPGALLKPFELDSRSAEAIESLLTETPAGERVWLPSQAVVAPRTRPHGRRKRSSALEERDRAILELAQTGVALSEIASRFGISRQRISQVIRAREHGSRAGAQLSPQELLEAHAALVEARQSADTRGARQGATRRIRNVEAALTERGVEFEPAKLGRPPRRSAPAPLTPQELLDAHAEAVAERERAETAGMKAGATRRIRHIEAVLTELGVDFEPAPLARSRGRSAAPSTPEELLAARAGWIEAREVAQTGGDRQGASRRIRNIERALRERGVEFEPAELGRPPRRSAPTASTPQELLEAHAALVEARQSADTRGARQGATRRIRNVEAALTERGVEFEPAELGRPPRRSAPAPLTPQELLDAHAEAVAERERAETAGMKAGATRRIRHIEAVLTELGVDFEPAPLARSRGRSAAPSTPEELLAARAGWIEAREVAQTGGDRQGASRRIRNIERALRERGVEFEPAELGRPPRRSAPTARKVGTPPDAIVSHPPTGASSSATSEVLSDSKSPSERVDGSESRLHRLRDLGYRRLADALNRPGRRRH